MITVSSRGSFRNMEAFAQRMKLRLYLTQLGPKYGQMGVAALATATPEDSGKTAESWTYEIVDRAGYYSIKWLNLNVEEPGHIPIAAIIQYGHGTKEGVFVQGKDYINPAMRPIFDQIVADMWKEVTK